MTVVHMAMFRWKDGVTPEQVDAFIVDLATMPDRIDCLRKLRFGPDLHLRDGNFDFGVCAELNEESEVSEYLDHPAHQELVANHVVHMVHTRRAVQFTV